LRQRGRRREREHRISHQFLKHALVQRTLGFSTGRIFLCMAGFCQERTGFRVHASETDLVVHFQAVPMSLELLQTVFAHLADAAEANGRRKSSGIWPVVRVCRREMQGRSVQVNSTSSYPSTLLQTVSGLSILCLTEHEVLCRARALLSWSR
jgi:hypothetical protein